MSSLITVAASLIAIASLSQHRTFTKAIAPFQSTIRLLLRTIDALLDAIAPLFAAAIAP